MAVFGTISAEFKEVLEFVEPFLACLEVDIEDEVVPEEDEGASCDGALGVRAKKEVMGFP